MRLLASWHVLTSNMLDYYSQATLLDNAQQWRCNLFLLSWDTIGNKIATAHKLRDLFLLTPFDMVNNEMQIYPEKETISYITI